MRLLEDLSLFSHGIAVAMMVGLLGGMLSVIVVTKRLAFVGQGVSHAAFGGVGLAAVLGFGSTQGLDPLVRTLIVAGFSIAAGLVIARLSRSNERRTDTAIGIVMTGSMALGFVLYRVAAQRIRAGGGGRLPGIEGVLFGDLLSISPRTMWATAGIVGLITVLLVWQRRSILLWTFDEPACEPAGIRGRWIGTLVLVLLAGAVVLAVQVAGVVLATAILVLPGAAALCLTRSLVPAFALSMAIGLATVAIGVVGATVLDWPIGATIALSQCAAWGLAACVGRR